MDPAALRSTTHEPDINPCFSNVTSVTQFFPYFGSTDCGLENRETPRDALFAWYWRRADSSDGLWPCRGYFLASLPSAPITASASRSRSWLFSSLFQRDC